LLGQAFRYGLDLGLLQGHYAYGWRWIVDVHREGCRYIVHSDELLTVFLELEATLL